MTDQIKLRKLFVIGTLLVVLIASGVGLAWASGIPIAGMGSAKAQALQCALRSTRQDFSNDL